MKIAKKMKFRVDLIELEMKNETDSLGRKMIKKKKTIKSKTTR